MQIVIFKLGEEHFAVDTDKVLSINDIMTITKVPKSPDYIKGLINLRGSIKSVIDINLLLNIKSSSEQKNIIILKVDHEEIGIIVDEVEEVVDVNSTYIKNIESNSVDDYIIGLVNLDKRLLTIIDFEKLLNLSN